MRRTEIKRTTPLPRGNGIKRGGRIKPRKFSKKPAEDGASLRQIKDELDSLVRKIVAVRDHKCATCWAHSNLHVGHLFRRGLEHVRWNLLNCAAQCDPCNSLHETEPEHYMAAFIQKHGEQAYNNLRIDAHKQGKLTYTDLLAIRDGLRVKLAELAQ